MLYPNDFMIYSEDHKVFLAAKDYIRSCKRKNVYVPYNVIHKLPPHLGGYRIHAPVQIIESFKVI